MIISPGVASADAAADPASTAGPGADRPPPLYGLDIETDTRTDGLDPRVSPVLAVAVSLAGGERVFTGPETGLLRRLDRFLRSLPEGILVTWNGAAFDLPFLVDRAERAGVSLGLELWPDHRFPTGRWLPGHQSPYAAAWHGHGHLDAYRLYRPVRLALGVSASLKSVAHHLGLHAPLVDRSRVHELSRPALEAYVASDARLARLLAERQWPRAGVALDQPAPGAQR